MRKRLKEERGQASLFMALFISTMILLFAFATNVGMLVHAKINLQNAADAAAYAGAAVQARQLTSIAYLNYEMRRALKDFLFFYTIRSQFRAMPCFPLDVNGTRLPGCAQPGPEGRHDFRFEDPRETGNNEQGGPYLPSVCIIFDDQNNYCQKNGVPGIPEFRGGGSWGVADPIVAAVRSATNQIINKKLEDCLGRTQINQQFLAEWLFNIDPYPHVLTTGKDSDDPFPASEGLERVGVLPRMALLRARIDNFEEALNLNLSNEGIGTATINEEVLDQIQSSIGGSKTLDYFERPIQAYLSAKNNLPGVGADNGIFANIELSELLPNQAPMEPSQGLRNPPILAKMNDVFTRITTTNSKFETKNVLNRGDCFQYREERVIPRFPYGVTKDPNILTYYAVRLQAKARLLFSPFGGNGVVTLSAYSAAKPFGSRIGVDLATSESRMDAYMRAEGKLDITTPMGTFLTPRMPNVLVARDDFNSQTEGFIRNGHLGYIRGAMLAFNRLDYGPRLAGAYAPWEVGLYTVPANYNNPQEIGLFEDNPSYEGTFFTLTAPVFPVNSSVDLSFLRPRIAQYLAGSIQDENTLKGQFFDFLWNTVLSDAKWAALFGYLTSSGQVDSHRIPDPLLNDEPQLLGYAKAYGSRYTVAGMNESQNRQLTSWNNQKTADDRDPSLGIAANSELGADIGRSGYSVRFISFDMLLKGGRTTNDPELVDAQWSNPFTRFNAGEGAARVLDDLSNLKH